MDSISYVYTLSLEDARSLILELMTFNNELEPDARVQFRDDAEEDGGFTGFYCDASGEPLLGDD